MPDEKFKLPRSSYPELTKIIVTYGQSDKPESLDAVSKLAGVNPTVISANAGFLMAAEILERGRKKQLSPVGRELARALEHKRPDESRRYWRQVIQQCDFLSRLVTSVKIRGGMDENTLAGHIAYSAGQSKKRSVMTGARTITDILQAAGMLREVEGKLTVAEDLQVEPRPEEPRKEPQEKTADIRLSDASPESAGERVGARAFGMQVNIQLRVDCKASELEGLGAKIREVIAEITCSAGASVEQESGADES